MPTKDGSGGRSTVNSLQQQERVLRGGVAQPVDGAVERAPPISSDQQLEDDACARSTGDRRVP